MRNKARVLKRTATHCNTQAAWKLAVEAAHASIEGLWEAMLQVHCNTLQRTATHRNTLQHTAAYCNTLKHIVTPCKTLHHVATRCNILLRTTTHCTMLQHTAPRCNTLQHIATRCTALQHSNAHREGAARQSPCTALSTCHL